MPNEDAMLDPTVYDGLAGFRFALRQFLAFSEGATQAAGMTSHQYQALLVIQTQPGQEIVIRDFAEQMLLRHHGAVQLIDRLVLAGLVARRHSETDRRSVLVSMTDKGGTLLERLAAAHIEALLQREPLLAESLRRLREIGR
jgi:DNA-binding MarR family transcriptional regulator